jgi:NADH-quinone oxidoreductase subunit L
MTWPLVILAGGALVVGWLGMPPFLGESVFAHWLEPIFGHPEHGLSHAEEIGLMSVSLGLAFGGAFLGYQMYAVGRVRPEMFTSLAGGIPYRLVYNKYWVDEIYHVVFVRGALLVAQAGALFDRHVIDRLVDGSAAVTRVWSWVAGAVDLRFVDGLVNLLSDSVLEWGSRLRKVQTGNINVYLYAVVAGVVGVMIVRLLWFGGA